MTRIFQLIVDTYGVPTYLEASPVPVSIVTFPFLFGMMFGDMGHGSIYLLLGLILVLFNDQLKGGSLNGLLPLRYLVLLMGFFATYCGFIYNEWFSLTTEIFSTCYLADNRVQWNSTLISTNQTFTTDGDWVYIRKNFNCNYPFGMDPIWSLTSNRLNFSNGVKMKVAVIMAVLHMSLGIIQKGTNALYFGRHLDFWTEVVSGLCIFYGLFGWMDALIVAKWFLRIDIEDTTGAPDLKENRMYYETEDEVKLKDGTNYHLAFAGDYHNQRAPSIINIMITEVFKFGAYDDKFDAVIGGDNKT